MAYKKKKNKFRLKHLLYVAISTGIMIFLDFIFDERKSKKKDKKKNKKKK